MRSKVIKKEHPRNFLKRLVTWRVTPFNRQNSGLVCQGCLRDGDTQRSACILYHLISIDDRTSLFNEIEQMLYVTA